MSSSIPNPIPTITSSPSIPSIPSLETPKRSFKFLWIILFFTILGLILYFFFPQIKSFLLSLKKPRQQANQTVIQQPQPIIKREVNLAKQPTTGQSIDSTMPDSSSSLLKNDPIYNAINKENSVEKQDLPQPLQADDAVSSIQSSKIANKGGWCFIGEDRNFRSCALVNNNDMCMSGDIFPSHDVCINPNLR